jgi:hypothetical protein
VVADAVSTLVETAYRKFNRHIKIRVGVKGLGDGGYLNKVETNSGGFEGNLFVNPTMARNI